VAKALITGINGFTGRYVARELEKAGYEVHGLGPEESTNPRFHRVDLLDGAMLKQVIDEVGPAAVVHLAGVSHVMHSNANAFYDVHVVGSRNLLEALASLAKAPDSILLASSATIYGNAAEGVLNETTPANPASDYAVSKLAMEYMARLWSGKLPVVVARPFNYTGIGQTEDFVIPKIVSHFRRRAPFIELGKLDILREYNDVRMVANAYRRLIGIRARDQVVNICSGNGHALKEVIAILESLTGHRLEVRASPALVRRNEVLSLCGNPARLHALIGTGQEYPLQDTLRWMLEG
jgi:GDP-6-deoxy-D-talose 4-dehydrogenase